MGEVSCRLGSVRMGGPMLDVCRWSVDSLWFPRDPRRQAVGQTRRGLYNRYIKRHNSVELVE